MRAVVLTVLLSIAGFAFGVFAGTTVPSDCRAPAHTTR